LQQALFALACVKFIFERVNNALGRQTRTVPGSD